jgi:hypothetical protein
MSSSLNKTFTKLTVDLFSTFKKTLFAEKEKITEDEFEAVWRDLTEEELTSHSSVTKSSSEFVADKCIHRYKTGNKINQQCTTNKCSGYEKCLTHLSAAEKAIVREAQGKEPAKKKVAKKAKKDNSDDDEEEEKKTVKPTKAKKPSVKVTKDAYGRHIISGFVVDPKTSKALGRPSDDGTTDDLTPDDITECKSLGMEYVLPKSFKDRKVSHVQASDDESDEESD